MIRQWLDSKTTITAKEIMERLTIIVPNEYSGSSQLRTLQRRIKQWHEEQAKDLVMGQLWRSTAVHGCEEKLDASPPVQEQTTT